jgi:signal transduction histidine kinase
MGWSITLADGGHDSLAHVVKPLAVEDLIGLAEQLARAVAEMHDRGVMHRDICPANIVLSSRGAPRLVDFASATSLAEIRPEFSHHTQILGTLSYSAPEQTGRTARPVDHRADLYALGATLYELATCEPPFGSGDALRLIHDHLARVSQPPIDVNPAVGQGLSQIIMHLLEKEPDDRYQSANGLIHDPVKLRQLGVSTTLAPRVGARDFPLRLVPPSRLIGRDDEVATLQEAFYDALRGGRRGVLVNGPPEVGKTALIDQLRPVVTGNDGWFVAGKFDQYRRDLEFDGIFQAFRALGRLLLSEPDDELAQLRDRMLAALGPNAGTAAAVLPEFAVLLDVPPETGDPLTAQLRVQRGAADVLRAVASRKRPVMLFVDDLQWAGPTSAGQLAVSLDNAQLYSELTASRARIVAASDQTRRQIERDLHDGAQQRLVSLILELGMAQADVPTEEGELQMRLGDAIEQARDALKELRDLSRGIHPAILTDGGLGQALRALTRRSPIPVQLDQRIQERLPDQVEISAYYIVAEALTNAAKHSGASVITVSTEVEEGDATLRVEVADDGVGGAEFSGGTGLLGLKDRVDALGGRIDLHSPRGRGTTLRVTLPIKRANGES